MFRVIGMSTTISIKTSKSTEFIDIKEEVKRAVEKSGIDEGAVNVYTKHTTTAIIINESEPGLLRDYENLLESLVPRSKDYAHDKVDSNAHAHLKSILLGPAKLIPVAGGKLQLGTWQKIFLVELDGPRNRSVFVVEMPNECE
jgi:secondary thiamine-phosphate synthase enzyme